MITETQLDIEKIRRDFPVLERHVYGKPLIYLDSAATSQKPKSVIDALTMYYSEQNSNVHRGMHKLAEEATIGYENTREKVAQFINANSVKEIIFTSSTTEAINLVAYSWGNANIKQGDHILLTEMEHHANHVPWLMLAEQKDAIIDFIPIDEEGRLIFDKLDELINPRTKLVALTQMSNVLGTINPLDEIITKAHGNGALVLIDAAQSVPHMPVDVREMDADFLAFSAHKMLGPTGVGVLYGKHQILEEMEPFNMGGEMIGEVGFDKVTWADLPHKFEAGTPNIAGVNSFSAALEYLENIGMHNVREHEMEMTAYSLNRLKDLDFIDIIGPPDPETRGGAITFSAKGLLHPHDVAQLLDGMGIAVRAGHHCAQPLHTRLGLIATTRASFYIYNTFEEIDKLVEGLIKAKDYFG